MLIKITTIGGAMLLNTNVIDAVTPPFEKEEGSLLWLSKKNLPDSGYGDYGDELLWVNESLDEILKQLAGARA